MAKKRETTASTSGTSRKPSRPVRARAIRKVSKPKTKSKAGADAAAASPAPVRRRTPRGSADDVRIRRFASSAALLLRDSHFTDVLVFDVRGLSDVTDYILIASGTSDRQIRSISEEVEKLAKESDVQRFGRSVDARATWVVLDFVDVIIHLFEPIARAHYDLEMLWGDAPKVRWQRKANTPAPGLAEGAGGEDEAEEE